MMIAELIDVRFFQKSIADWARRKGWHVDMLTPEEPDIRRKALAGIAICHRELSVVLEKIREHGVTIPTIYADRCNDIAHRGINMFAILEKLALVHSETTEAVDAVLHHGLLYWLDPERANEHFPEGKPEGFGSELADIVIRVFHLADMCGFDLQALIAEKMAYNEGRPFKHGKTA